MFFSHAFCDVRGCLGVLNGLMDFNLFIHGHFEIILKYRVYSILFEISLKFRSAEWLFRTLFKSKLLFVKSRSARIIFTCLIAIQFPRKMLLKWQPNHLLLLYWTLQILPPNYRKVDLE